MCGTGTKHRDAGLTQCQGDCDTDAECATGYYCFQRVLEAVPGCSDSEGPLAGPADWDYCTRKTSYTENEWEITGWKAGIQISCTHGKQVCTIKAGGSSGQAKLQGEYLQLRLVDGALETIGGGVAVLASVQVSISSSRLSS